MTEDNARVAMEMAFKQCLIEQFGGSSYRGYAINEIRWPQSTYSFRVSAFMPNSPLHPHDGMILQSEEVGDWKAYCHEATCSVLAYSAVNSLKRLIDMAYSEPANVPVLT